MRNKVLLHGHAGKDPEYKDISAKFKVAEFSLATTIAYNNDSGERVTQTQWHKIKGYNGFAGIINKFVRKGSEISVEGSLRYDDYLDKNGSKQVRAYVLIEDIIVHTKVSAVSTKPKKEPVDAPVDTDDLPF